MLLANTPSSPFLGLQFLDLSTKSLSCSFLYFKSVYLSVCNFGYFLLTALSSFPIVEFLIPVIAIKIFFLEVISSSDIGIDKAERLMFKVFMTVNRNNTGEVT